MRAVILQPNYISWRGYFDFFKRCDVFVVYDDVQYTRRDWRNRNIIKTPDGSQWLTIPVNDNDRKMLIKDATMQQNGWQERHLKQIQFNYAASPYVGEVCDILSEAFAEEKENLCRLNMAIIRRIMDYIGMTRKVVYSSEVGCTDASSTERLVALCRKVGATEYLSGEAAKDYLEVDKFGDIRVLWHRYKERVYPQLWGEFLSRVSIIDTLANLGTKAYDLI